MTSDTIFALSSAPGKAGVAIVRISGGRSWDVLKALGGGEPEERRLSLKRLIWNDFLLDEALVARFGAGRSFTGEESAEFHVHGGRAVIQAVLNALAQFEGVRAAEPGEFTRRALSNGRVDLGEAEALADLIDAETEAQRRQALDLMAGGAEAEADAWRADLLLAVALLEASIDFADEDDAPEDVAGQVNELLASVSERMAAAIRGASAGARVREGYRIALVGAPNVGKSSLVNALARRQAAITSPIAGTTRDVIDVACDFNGLPVILQDMAGLRETEDVVESIGVERARDIIDAADLRLFLGCDQIPFEALEARRKQDLKVWSKADLGHGDADAVVSAELGAGVAELVELICERLVETQSVSRSFARFREEKKLVEALAEVGMARETEASELKVAHLNRGLRVLDGLFAPVTNEDVLGEIFSRFCMGK